MKNKAYCKVHDTKINEPGNVPAVIVISGVVILVAIMYWYITVPAAGLVSGAWLVRKYRRYIKRPERLVVRRYDATVVGEVWNNIIEMVREGALHA